MFDLLFWFITLLWLLEFFYRKSRTLKKNNATTQERITFPFILFALLISIIASVLLSLQNIASVPAEYRWVGLVLYASGVLLRWWGIITLGEFFTRDIIVTQDMDLVSTGPYRIIRHPLYTGLLLCPIGIALSLGTWLGVCISILLLLPTLIVRIMIEERYMANALGARYQEWCVRRWRLRPYVF